MNTITITPEQYERLLKVSQNKGFKSLSDILQCDEWEIVAFVSVTIESILDPFSQLPLFRQYYSENEDFQFIIKADDLGQDHPYHNKVIRIPRIESGTGITVDAMIDEVNARVDLPAPGPEANPVPQTNAEILHELRTREPFLFFTKSNEPAFGIIGGVPFVHPGFTRDGLYSICITLLEIIKRFLDE